MMLNSIRNHLLIKGITGFILVGLTVSFPLSVLKLADENQNRTRPAAVKRNNVKPYIAKPVPDNKENPAPGKDTQIISQTVTKPDSSIRTPAKSRENAGNNQVSWLREVDKAPVSSRKNYNNEQDIYLLARVIHAEARGEPLVGQVAVGAVLLNRLQDKRFPKTLSQIIFKRGEFCTVRDGQIWMKPSSQAIRAARLAISGWDPTGGAVYFYNPAKTTSRWIWSRPVVNKIGNHFFAV